MKAYRIETAQEADANSIKTLVKQAKLDSSDLRWQKFWVARPAETTDSDSPGVIGCVQLKDYPGVRELASLVVAKAWRKQGIGGALVQQVLQAGRPPIYLLCPHYRRNFYEGHGFHVVGFRDGLPPILALQYGLARLFVGPIFKIRILAMRWDGPLSERA